MKYKALTIYFGLAAVFALPADRALAEDSPAGCEGFERGASRHIFAKQPPNYRNINFMYSSHEDIGYCGTSSAWGKGPPNLLIYFFQEEAARLFDDMDRPEEPYYHRDDYPDRQLVRYEKTVELSGREQFEDLYPSFRCARAEPDSFYNWSYGCYLDIGNMPRVDRISSPYELELNAQDSEAIQSAFGEGYSYSAEFKNGSFALDCKADGACTIKMTHGDN